MILNARRRTMQRTGIVALRGRRPTSRPRYYGMKYQKTSHVSQLCSVCSGNQTCLRKSSTHVSTRQTLGLLRLQKTLLCRKGRSSKLAVLSQGTSLRQIVWLCSINPTSQSSDDNPNTSPCLGIYMEKINNVSKLLKC